MKRRIASLLLALVMVLSLAPATVFAAEQIPFTATVNEEACAVTKTSQTYTSAWPETTVGLFAVTVPATATSVELHFGSEHVLVYNYTADGDYLSGFYASATATDPMYIGVSEQTVPIDYDGDGATDYIQVHDPYNPDWSGGDLRYAITFCFADGTTAVGATGSNIVPAESAQNVYRTTGDYLEGLGAPAAGSEWRALGLARSGRTVAKSYYESVVSYMNTLGKNQISGTKATENARMILAVTACDHDATTVGTYDLTAGFTSMEYVEGQGTNGPVFTLLALDSHNYAVPTGTDITREKLVESILSAQLEDGGFYISSSKKISDVDMTAMALCALKPYYDKDHPAVKSAVDKALAYLSGVQKPDGGFAEDVNSAQSSESAAQVLVALCTLGIDPDNDSRFIKNGFTTLDAMLRFYTDGGGFAHTKGGSRSGIATEQCYYALCAYFRMRAAKAALYDMSDLCIGHHSFGDWQVTHEATSTKAGEKQRTCSHCGYVETQTIPATGRGSSGDTKPAEKAVHSAATGDMGIAIYCAMAISGMMGSARVLHRREGEIR